MTSLPTASQTDYSATDVTDDDDVTEYGVTARRRSHIRWRQYQARSDSVTDDDVTDDYVTGDGDAILGKQSIVAKFVGNVFVVVAGGGERRGGVTAGDPAVAWPATGLEDDANNVLLLLNPTIVLVGRLSGARRVVEGWSGVWPEERVPVAVQTSATAFVRGAEPRQGLLGPKRGRLEAPGTRLVGRRWLLETHQVEGHCDTGDDDDDDDDDGYDDR